MFNEQPVDEIRSRKWFKALPTMPGRTYIQQAARLIHAQKLTGIALTSDEGQIIAVLPAAGIISELGTGWPNSRLAIAGRPREEYVCSGTEDIFLILTHLREHNLQHVIVRAETVDFAVTLADIGRMAEETLREQVSILTQQKMAA